MLFKLLLIIILLGVVASLVSGVLFRKPDPGPQRSPSRPGAIRKLTIRIALSLVVFAILILGVHWGWYSSGIR